MLCVLQILEERDLLKHDGPVRNLTLVLGQLMQSAVGWGGDEDEPKLSWVDVVVQKLHQHHIHFEDPPHGIKAKYESVDTGQSAEAVKKKMWKNIVWKNKVGAAGAR